MDEGKRQGRTLDDSLTIQRFVLVRDEEIFSFVSAVRGRFQGTGSAKNLPRVLAAQKKSSYESFQVVIFYNRVLYESTLEIGYL